LQVAGLRACVDAGARITEVPIHFHPRSEGRSTMSVEIMLEGLTVTWACRQRSAVSPTVALASEQ
jgi:ABC-type ATPase with predicted acetyltransferase domain